MKRTLCIVLAILTALTCIFAFASCKNDPDPSVSGTTAGTDETTEAPTNGTLGANDLEKIKAAGKVVVGMECKYAPYNWAQTTETENTVKVRDGMFADGYDVQIAKKIAAGLGVTLEIKPFEWDGLIPAVNAGDIDLIIAGMSPEAKRKLSVDFSDVYFESNLVVVCKKDSPYASATKIADFKDAKITGQHNTFHYAVIDQIEGVKKQTALPDFAALTEALKAGSIDGYVCEKPGGESAVASNSSFMFIEFADGNGFTCDPEESSIAVAMRKGSSLTAEINKIIASIPKAEREALMNACVARQPVTEDDAQ